MDKIDLETNYQKLIMEHLKELYNDLPSDLGRRIGAEKRQDHFYFTAFGRQCCLGPEGITLSDQHVTGPKGLLIALYAINATLAPIRLEPFTAFKDIPGTMPYQGAFHKNSEAILLPTVSHIEQNQQALINTFRGRRGPEAFSGDFSFILYPLPKIALCYIFYNEDDEFPPSATCLFSANAPDHMPLDGLADVAEYTSKTIIKIVRDLP